jgi:asparagine synthase (glutamine-hydrolysing)
VTVSLSGDAGDELFGGYNRYLHAEQLMRTLSMAPRPLRQLSGGALRAMPTAGWGAMFAMAGPVLPQRLRVANPGQKIHKLANVISAGTLQSVYRGLVSQWQDPAAIVRDAHEPVTLLSDHTPIAALEAPLARMTYLDMVGYLPDDILVKVDRASMAVSLESRVPLLDHRVVEFAWRVPLHMKVRNGQGKILLRRVLERYVPRALFERPKMGFGVPIDSWLRGPLRDWADHLLDPAVLRAQGYFNEAPITQAWREHRSGQRLHHYALWVVLMFQSWLQSLDARPAA